MSEQQLVPGRNCWRVEPATRAAFVVDGAAYFRAFREAVARAQRSVLILSWDINSRVRLVREGPPEDGLPATLGEFLNAVVAARPALQVYLLSWDFAMIYTMEREWLPLWRLGFRTHRRLHFRLDARHPVGASHHQKVVVVDDRIAFSGGLDLTKWRWDTPAHPAADPRRIDSDQVPYPPFHDVQMVVEGPAAAALGELARERWYLATGRRIPFRPAAGDPWPPSVPPDLHDTRVAIARTLPRHNGQREVREVEQQFLDLIAAARGYIYIENQYFTSRLLAEALAERLRPAEGPEVVLVLPLKTGGWLEQYTMDVLRQRVLERLRRADRHGRLRLLYPHQEGLGERCITVHGKVLIVDDTLVRIGSANLSNRSMGLDTECDLTIEARGPREREAAAALLARLLAEHLGSDQGRVAAEIAARGSLIRAIEALMGAGRSLRPLSPPPVPAEIEQLVPDARLVDPERPIDPDLLADQLVPRDERRPVRRRLVRLASLLVVLLALAAAWHYTPLAGWLELDNLEALLTRVEHHRLAPLLVLGGYVLGGVLVMPVSLLIVATVFTFGPLLGLIYSVSGSLLSAAATYALGHLLGREAVRRMAGSRINRLSRRLARRGLLAVAVVRFFPIAPFTVVNIVAGASEVRFRDFILGTVIGMLPGIVAVTLIAAQLESALFEPKLSNLLLLLAVAIGAATFILLLRRLLRRRERERMVGPRAG